MTTTDTRSPLAHRLLVDLLPHLLADVVDVTPTEQTHRGTFVQTPYGVVWLPRDRGAEPVLAVAEDPSRQWHYLWTLVDDLAYGTEGPTPEQVWRAAATSTRRAEVAPVEVQYVATTDTGAVVWHTDTDPSARG